VSKKRRLPSGSERWREAKRRPAQRLSCEARMHGFVCLQEVVAEAAQGEQSGCQEDATPTAAEKGESGDESDLLTEDRDRAGLRGSANRGSRGPKGGIQVDCSWGHRRRASALRLLTQLFLDEGVYGSYRSHFLSRKSLTASQE
jgi:hypothetical protein